MDDQLARTEIFVNVFRGNINTECQSNCAAHLIIFSFRFLCSRLLVGCFYLELMVCSSPSRPQLETLYLDSLDFRGRCLPGVTLSQVPPLMAAAKR